MSQFTPWNWSIGIAVFQDEFYKELEQMKLYIMLITAGVALLGLGVFYLGSSRKSQTAQASHCFASKEIAAGNLERTSLKETTDEIGQLAKGFNHMSGELRALVSGLQETSVTSLLNQRQIYRRYLKKPQPAVKKLAEPLATYRPERFIRHLTLMRPINK
nr:HAMP domain-containing protein [Bacillus pumilus]